MDNMKSVPVKVDGMCIVIGTNGSKNKLNSLLVRDVNDMSTHAIQC